MMGVELIEDLIPVEVVLWELIPCGAGGFLGRQLARLRPEPHGFSGPVTEDGCVGFFRVYGRNHALLFTSTVGEVGDLRLTTPPTKGDQVDIQ